MKFTLYFFYEQWNFEAAGKVIPWHIKLNDETIDSRIRIFLCEKEFEIPEIDIPDENEIKQIMIDGFRKEKEDIQAETFVKLKAIDDKIQQLLCIEIKPEE